MPDMDIDALWPGKCRRNPSIALQVIQPPSKLETAMNVPSDDQATSNILGKPSKLCTRSKPGAPADGSADLPWLSGSSLAGLRRRRLMHPHQQLAVNIRASATLALGQYLIAECGWVSR